MKMRCEILAVRSGANDLRIEVQGRQVNATQWSHWHSFTVIIPDSAKSRAAFHVGRLIFVTVEPVK
jgi:hypothetical protein